MKRLIITVMIVIVLFGGACNSGFKANEAEEYGLKVGVDYSLITRLRPLNGLDENEKKFIDIVATLPIKMQGAVIDCALDRKISQEEIGVVLYKRGSISRQQKKYDEALADFNEAIKLAPKLFLSYLDRGLIYFQKSNYDQAIADFNEVIAFGPKAEIYYRKAYFYRGICYLEKDNYDEAISDFNKTIEIGQEFDLRTQPSIGDPYFFRGKAYYEKKDYSRAVADFNEALKRGLTTEVKEEYALESEKPDWWAECNFFKAKAHLALKERDKAKKHLYYTIQISHNPQLIKEAKDILKQEFGE